MEGITQVRTFKTIIYQNLYPEIDLICYKEDAGLFKYNFIVHSGGNIDDIRLKIKGPDEIKETEPGLNFETELGLVTETIPLSFRVSGGENYKVKIRFQKIDANVYGFSVDDEIPEGSEIIIDPEPNRLWGTYYGGYGDESGLACSKDINDNEIIAGFTSSTNNIATSGAYQTTFAGYYDVFLVKFNNNGVRIWGTYFGGSGYENAYACPTNSNGDIFISGYTSSNANIATPGAHQTSYGGNMDGFIAKFNANGIRQWSTYYGGPGVDYLFSGVTDVNGDLIVSGMTSSSNNIATPGAYQPVLAGNEDAWLAKFATNGTIYWGTYYGGEAQDLSFSCAVNDSREIALSGCTESTINIASPGSHQSVIGGGEDSYLAKFTPQGVRQWGTYYGGYYSDAGNVNCTFDFSGNVFLAGETYSTNNIATPGAHQTVISGPYDWDGFLVKFNGNGVRQWGTYYGGDEFDRIEYTFPDPDGNIFFVGVTYSPNNISTPAPTNH